MKADICYASSLPPGRGIASILISLAFRIAASILAVTPSPLKWKERIFVAVAWIPKATVQAAIGPLALDSARATGDPTLINWGEQLEGSGDFVTWIGTASTVQQSHKCRLHFFTDTVPTCTQVIDSVFGGCASREVF
ncbi:unnamed protein product [Hydatigera taeniaeformis]|uniref:Secreted protein n=1 Tax=Hydatigena taeniaeformis TaxID=6205 RepID=A0A0R3XA62_HYDTA|nr:unnamed protein product [Hydatigera taeniaeformis]